MFETSRIYVNLPVRDLAKSKEFFANLGFEFDATMTSDTAACMVIRKDLMYAMLLTQKLFQEFCPNPVADSRKVTEVVTSLCCESKEKVNEFADKALSLGATTFRDPMEVDWMFCRYFQDLDGHVWEITHMGSEPIRDGSTESDVPTGSQQ